MATPAERNAFYFFAAVALLGGGVRCWRARSHAPDKLAAARDAPAAEPRAKGHPKKNGRSIRRKPAVDIDTTLDPAAMVDLDVASAAEIDALGLLKPGQARQLVADRDRYGPFGSIQALERIPYFPKSAITKLAPRVTFSRVPRPSNTVIGGRPDPEPAVSRRRTRRHPTTGS